MLCSVNKYDVYTYFLLIWSRRSSQKLLLCIILSLICKYSSIIGSLLINIRYFPILVLFVGWPWTRFLVDTVFSKLREWNFYFRFMGGVDKHDQMLTYYSLSRKAVKWNNKYFFHLFDINCQSLILQYKLRRLTFCHEEHHKLLPIFKSFAFVPNKCKSK